MIPGLLLAAGQARRYGSQKMLERFRGESLLRRAARAFTDAGCLPLLVVLPRAPELRAELEGIEAVVVENPNPELGIAHSIVLGLKSLPEQAEAVVASWRLRTTSRLRMVRTLSASRRMSSS